MQEQTIGLTTEDFEAKLAEEVVRGDVLQLAGLLFFVDKVTQVIDLRGTRVEYQLKDYFHPDSRTAMLQASNREVVMTVPLFKLDI